MHISQKSIFYFLSKFKLKISVVLIFAIWYVFFSLPNEIFNNPTSTVMFDKHGELIAARLATDEQWRFAETDSVPYKFEKCILNFEDEYFYYHFGINPISIFKSFIQNIKNWSIKRGGSTITMQTMRMSRGNQSRNISQKIIEAILSTRLEFRYTKKEILKLYVSNAPFGSNNVGLDAAAWRYYNRSAHDLSWAESATLAVLPNAPSLIYPGRNHDRLKTKRNRLLDKLYANDVIDSLTCYLSKQEPIPEKPKSLPNITQHLLNKAINEGFKGKNIQSTVDASVQRRVVDIVASHYKLLKSNYIHNVSCLVLDVNTGEVIAYMGNTPKENNLFGQDVDAVMSKRSTGSVIKPLLYASALQDGLLLQNMLLVDIPTQYGGYSPLNYSKSFSGAIPAYLALSRSLNVPAVRLLKEYKTDRFLDMLHLLGITTMNKPADHYGLTLILGGAEASLWELSGIYASLARVLKNYENNSSQYFKEDMHMPYFTLDKRSKSLGYSPINASSIYLTFNAMKEVNRPTQEQGWQSFGHVENIAWKTGTSFGNRDAWSIGVSTDYVVGVWVGNADGEGRPDLTGVGSAAPIMFDVFKLFNTNSWFNQPYDDMKLIDVCEKSGYKASNICDETVKEWVQESGIESKPCPYHKLVHLSKDGLYRVNSSCENTYDIKNVSWFVLPAVMEWYYKIIHADYKTIPPYRKDCKTLNVKNIDIIYPENLTQIFLPKGFDGTIEKVVFKVVHRKSNSTIFWHIDNEYVGKTMSFHELALQPLPGKHKLTLVDENGESLERWFTIVEK